MVFLLVIILDDVVALFVFVVLVFVDVNMHRCFFRSWLQEYIIRMSPLDAIMILDWIFGHFEINMMGIASCWSYQD